jgi:hypothetical protein
VKLYPAIPVIALFLLSSTAAAQTAHIDFYNNTATDVCVEDQSRKNCQEVPSKRSGRVYIRNSQWIQFGMETFRYNVPRSFLKPDLRLQAEPDGKLYLVPPDTPLPASTLPKQPVGFPLAPTRKADLSSTQ